MPNRRFPRLVWSWERRVNRVEGVTDEWVRHGGRVAVGCDNIDSLQRNNFSRRSAVSCPVPVWRSQVLGCSDPALFIDLVRVCNLESVLLQHLLDHLIDIIMVDTRQEIVN